MTSKEEFDKLIMYFQLQGKVTHYAPVDPLDRDRIEVVTNNFKIQLYYITYPRYIDISSVQISDRREGNYRIIWGGALAFIELKHLQ